MQTFGTMGYGVQLGCTKESVLAMVQLALESSLALRSDLVACESHSSIACPPAFIHDHSPHHFGVEVEMFAKGHLVTLGLPIASPLVHLFGIVVEHSDHGLFASNLHFHSLLDSTVLGISDEHHLQQPAFDPFHFGVSTADLVSSHGPSAQQNGHATELDGEPH